MEHLEIILGVLVALLWAFADIIASLSARRWTTFKTTFASQFVGLCALLGCGGVSLLWQQTFTPSALLISALIGVVTGGCAAVGYFAFYRALEIGPVALISPLSATSSTVTLLLATVLLREYLSLWRIEIVILIVCGVVLSSTNVREIRMLLHKPVGSIGSSGVRWAIVAMLCFGVMDFGIGASSSLTNWLLPVIWTRLFSILFLVLISYLKAVRFAHSKRAVQNTMPDQNKKPCWQDDADPDATIKLPSLHASYLAGHPHKTYQSILQQKRVLLNQQASSLERTKSPGRAPDLSLPALKDHICLRRPSGSMIGQGLLLALVAGLLENAAVLTFSFDSRISSTGVTSVLGSSYAVVVILFGLLVYRERIAINQWLGITLFLSGLLLLAQ